MVGNDYEGEPCRIGTCVADCLALAAKLTSLGFAVTLVEDAPLVQLQQALVAFEAGLTRGCQVLVYLAGHGQEEDRHNFFIPQGMTQGLPLRRAAYPLEDIVHDLGHRASAAVVLVDVPRAYPCHAAYGSLKGAGRVRLGELGGLTIRIPETCHRKDQQYAFVFAADPRCSPLADGWAGRSPMAKCLLELLEPGTDLEYICYTMSRKIRTLSNQFPFFSLGGLVDPFSF